MTRFLLVESQIQIIVKVNRPRKLEVSVIIYHYNLGSVLKETYKEVKYEPFYYLAKNRNEILKKHKEILNQLEV